MKNTVAIWARVDPDDVRDIERSNPKWGWRTHLMSFVFSYLAARVRTGEGPSMEKLNQYAKAAVDEYLDNGRLKP